ncbi:MAG TPA: DUF5063 domain-containing protein [Kofleriaceae bacterium]
MADGPVEAFVARAREFVDFVARASTLSPSERLSTARSRLLDLYTAAVSLPADFAERVDADDTVTPPAQWPGFGSHDWYWEVFDPYIEAPLVMGSLSDDVLDVYRDIQRGLAQWDAGHRRAATWEWRYCAHSIARAKRTRDQGWMTAVVV